jgi:hypothetical protein
MLSLKKIFSDYMGVASSILCLIHCLGLPFVFFLGQYFGLTYLNSLKDTIEHVIFFDIIFLLTASISVYFALKHAHSKEIKILLSIGWTFFAIGAIFGNGLVNATSAYTNLDMFTTIAAKDIFISSRIATNDESKFKRHKPC